MRNITVEIFSVSGARVGHCTAETMPEALAFAGLARALSAPCSIVLTSGVASWQWDVSGRLAEAKAKALAPHIVSEMLHAWAKRTVAYDKAQAYALARWGYADLNLGSAKP